MATYVLLHGAYQGGWIWQRVTPHLRAAGHTVFAPTLDGCAERRHALRPGIDTESQAAEVSELLFFEDLHDIVLVGTSCGGMVAARVAENSRDRIGRIVFADALALFDGEAIGRHREAPDRGHHRRSAPARSREDAANRMFVSLTGPTKEWALARYTPHPVAAMAAPVKLDAVLAAGLEGLGDLVPAKRQPAGGAPEAGGGDAEGAMVRTGHRPLPDADRARGPCEACHDRVTACGGLSRAVPIAWPRNRGRRGRAVGPTITGRPPAQR